MTSKRANVLGVGMIGGSVASALRKQGWHVSGYDVDDLRAIEARDIGILDEVGVDRDAQVSVVAGPVSTIPELVAIALSETSGSVTDVGSVKRTIVDQVDDPRFIGGHPMAGSERSGLEGVRADLFDGATWALTPGSATDPSTYMDVHSLVTSLGANVVTLPAAEHDRIVATVSHVPHLVATALMNQALQARLENEFILRLAATGFRDMTRIAAGHPDLWTDITLQNRAAIVEALDELMVHLQDIRREVDDAAADELRSLLASAAEARIALPPKVGRPSELRMLDIQISDSPGSLGDVLTTLGDLRVNVEDISIEHDPRGDRGTLEVMVDADDAERAVETLSNRGFIVTVEGL